MAGPARGLRPLLLLLGAVAAGALLWVLVQDEPEASPPLERPGEAARAAEDGAAGPDEPEPQAPARRPPETRQTGLPRVLPADAAIEDIRDALALAEPERNEALDLARDGILRLAREGGSVTRDLQSYGQSVEDPIVRGVVIAGLGSLRNDTHLRWLCERLEAAATMPERLGALIALAQPDEAHANERKVAPDAARTAMLGGLTYEYEAIPPSPAAVAAVAHLLSSTRTDLALAALPILLRCIEEHGDWAALLVGDDGGMRPWFGLLAPEDRARVKAAALQHSALSASTRKTLTAAN